MILLILGDNVVFNRQNGMIRLILGCNFAGTNVSLLAYADDIVLLAPSWRALQYLLGGCRYQYKHDI